MFDLVVVMSVLENFGRPSEVRGARAKIVDLIAPAGYLLLSNARQKVVEKAWWRQVPYL